LDLSGRGSGERRRRRRRRRKRRRKKEEEEKKKEEEEAEEEEEEEQGRQEKRGRRTRGRHAAVVCSVVVSRSVREDSFSPSCCVFLCSFVLLLEPSPSSSWISSDGPYSAAV